MDTTRYQTRSHYHQPEPDQGQQRQCHDWHWLECDMRDCGRDGQVHMTVAGWDRQAWLCKVHADAQRAASR